MCIMFRRNVRNIARLTFNAVHKILILKIWFLFMKLVQTGFLLTSLTEGGVMTKIYSPAGLSFLSPVKIGALPSEKVSWSQW